jgi:predicted RNase H-like nuclease
MTPPPANAFLGIDGFRHGWVGAWISPEGSHDFFYASRLVDLLGYPHARAMVDMPIGLQESDRDCDLEARRMVGSSVFAGARRSLWDHSTHAEANKSYRAAGSKCVSIQLWSLRDKLCEVDRYVRSAPGSLLRETHPEVAFFKIDERKLDGKKSHAGRLQRIEILRRAGFTQIEAFLDQRRGTGIGRDDLIDACIAAIVARNPKGKLPKNDSPIDEEGLPMEIWY